MSRTKFESMARFEMRSRRHRKALIGWRRRDEVTGDEAIADEAGTLPLAFAGYVPQNTEATQESPILSFLRRGSENDRPEVSGRLDEVGEDCETDDVRQLIEWSRMK